MTRDVDAVLTERFNSIVHTMEPLDWGDVVARAGSSTGAIRSVRWRRPRLLAGLAAAFAVGVGASFLPPFHSSSAAADRTPGPTRVQRRVAGGTIHWLLAHEQRGQSLQAASIAPGTLVGGHWQPMKFARVVTPDPASKARIAVSLIGQRGRNICMTVFFPSATFGGCGFGFRLAAFKVTTASGLDVVGSNDAVVLAGLASDAVARMELYLPRGRHRSVPLKDNAFIIEVARADLPANLVAYDPHGLVIGTSGNLKPFNGLK